MKPLHSGGGEWRRGLGWRWWGAEAVRDFGRWGGGFSGEEGSSRVKGLEKPATCVGRASVHDRVPPECAFLSPESGSRVQTLCQSRPIAACETTI